MFSAMLEVNPIPAQFDAYLGMAKMLRPELEQIDGFIDNDRYASLTRDGWLLSLSSWRDEKALVRWRTTARHHKIQEAARERIFADYRLRIGQVVADNHLPADMTLPEQRLTAAGDGTAVTLLQSVRARQWLDAATATDVATSLGLHEQAQGLVKWDVFQALLAPDQVIAVLTWRDEAAADTFRQTATLPDDVHVRSIRVVREYGMFDRREAPQYFPDAQPTKAPAAA